jgi:serine phosphatase RsbU (regulator of sigma subunit)
MPRPITAAARKALVIENFAALAHDVEPHALGAVPAMVGKQLSWRDCAMYLVDLDQRVLVEMLPDASPGEKLDVDATVAGRAYRHVAVQTVTAEGGTRVWAPLLDGADRLGVIGVTCEAGDDDAPALCTVLADVVASLVASASKISDAPLLLRRTDEVDLAAELRWSLMPPLSCSSGRVSLAGVMEPAYEIAGDSFDYAIDRDRTHFAIFDAVGHGLEATRLANLAIGCYRHSRRLGYDLVRTYRAMDGTVAEQFGEYRYVTAQLAQLDTDTGILRWLNAGHPAPLREHAGGIAEVEGHVCVPAGLADIVGAQNAEVCESELRPGDHLILYSDGVTEARTPDGETFGIGRLLDFLARGFSAGEPLPEMVRRLIHGLLDHQQGSLQDDATLIVLRWDGPAR